MLAFAARPGHLPARIARLRQIGMPGGCFTIISTLTKVRVVAIPMNGMSPGSGALRPASDWFPPKESGTRS